MESVDQDEEFVLPTKYSDLHEQSDDLHKYTVDKIFEFETAADASEALNSIEGFILLLNFNTI